MKKRHKILMGIAAMVVFAVFAAFFSVNSLTRMAVEKGGSYAMGTETRLDRARIAVFSGSSTIRGLTVANPPGFQDRYFFTLRRGRLDLLLGSLFRNRIEVTLLELEGLEIYLERSGEKPNYKVVLENLEKAIGPEGGTRYIVRSIVIRDITARVNVISLAGKAGAVTVQISELRLENYSDETTGGQVLSQLMGTLVKTILFEVARKGKGLIPNDLSRELQNLTGDVAKLVGGVVEKAGVAAGEGAGKLLEDVGGLLKKK